MKVSVVKGLAFQAREWLRKRGAVVGLKTAGVVILIADADAGAGASLAVTGVLAAPEISIYSTPSPTATPTRLPVATDIAEVPKPRTRLYA